MLTLTLSSMAHGGSALGRHDGRPVFVPFAIPGETVHARIVQDKGSYLRAELVEVLEASPERVTPRCKHFGRCGGCQWQHMTYAAQLAYKQQVVAEQFARIGGLPDAPVLPVAPSADPWGYRTHITLRLTEDGRPGFIATDGRTVMPIDECHIIRPEIRAALDVPLPRGRQVRVQAGSSGAALAFVMKALPDDDAGGTSESQRALEYVINGRTLRCTAGGFFQVNLPQAARLVDLVLERLALTGTERVLDLYSGVGLFTVFLAAAAREVLAVELFAPAVRDAEHNLAAFDNVALYVGKIEAVLPDLSGPFDAAVVDPPRTGMDSAALKSLVDADPRRIVYVSCDPATLARDAKKLVAAGYALSDVQPIDMFPQTFHIEMVARFERN
jgi:23S rRNA (uracil1939-C5)-methyltransferase